MDIMLARPRHRHRDRGSDSTDRDPWLTGNPDAGRRAARGRTVGVTQILVTTAISTTPKTLKMVAEKTVRRFAGMVELMGIFGAQRRGKHTASTKSGHRSAAQMVLENAMTMVPERLIPLRSMGTRVRFYMGA